MIRFRYSNPVAGNSENIYVRIIKLIGSGFKYIFCLQDYYVTN